MARKTTNARLGILGGISILGTTGIVRPFSTAAWRASVEQAVSVLAAQAAETSQDPVLVLCTGGRTEKGAMLLFPDLPEVSFVEVGDFTGAALRRCVEHGVRRVVFVGMAGKLTKLGAGVLMTHYTRSKVDCSLLGEITRAVGGPRRPRGHCRRCQHRAPRLRTVGRRRLAARRRPRTVPPCRRGPGTLRRHRVRRHDQRRGRDGRLQRAGSGGADVITVIGFDGTPLSEQARAALASATLVVGGQRHLDAVDVRFGGASRARRS